MLDVVYKFLAQTRSTTTLFFLWLLRRSFLRCSRWDHPLPMGSLDPEFREYEQTYLVEGFGVEVPDIRQVGLFV